MQDSEGCHFGSLLFLGCQMSQKQSEQNNSESEWRCPLCCKKLPVNTPGDYLECSAHHDECDYEYHASKEAKIHQEYREVGKPITAIKASFELLQSLEDEREDLQRLVLRKEAQISELKERINTSIIW